MFALLSLACVDSRLRILPLLKHQHKVELFFWGLGSAFGKVELENKVERAEWPRIFRSPHIGHDRADHGCLKIAAPITEWLDLLQYHPLSKFAGRHPLHQFRSGHPEMRG